MESNKLTYRAGRLLSRTLPTAWPLLYRIATALVTPIRFSIVTGHWQSSIAGVAKSHLGEPIPWYTYPAIDFLSQRDFVGRHVLEFGGGQSTLWWSRKATNVLTFEEDEQYYRHLASRVPDNVVLHHVPVDPTSRTIQPIHTILNNQPLRNFDVIVVDGHLRRKLTGLAFDYLAKNGALILDDSEGYGFYDEIKSRNCNRIDFFGFAPGVLKRRCTSLVFVDDCFLLNPRWPIADLENP